MSRPVMVIGGGGHSRVVLEALRQSGVAVEGIVDPEPRLAGGALMGVPVVGGDEAMGRYPPERFDVAVGVGSMEARGALCERYHTLGYRFVRVIHPSASVASDVVLGEGVQVMAGAVLQPGVEVGEHSVINTLAGVDHDCVLGAHVHIAPGAVLCGGVRVGDRAIVGAGAVVVQGVRIDADSFIKAATRVSRDVDGRVGR